MIYIYNYKIKLYIYEFIVVFRNNVYGKTLKSKSAITGKNKVLLYACEKSRYVSTYDTFETMAQIHKFDKFKIIY